MYDSAIEIAVLWSTLAHNATITVASPSRVCEASGVSDSLAIARYFVTGLDLATKACFLLQPVARFHQERNSDLRYHVERNLRLG